MFWFDLSALLKQPLIATKPPAMQVVQQLIGPSIMSLSWEQDLFSASWRKQIIVLLFKRVPDSEYYT